MFQNKSTDNVAFNPSQATRVVGLIDYRIGSIRKMELLTGAAGRVVLFAFDEGKGLSEHTSDSNVLIHIVEGEAEITISSQTNHLETGELILIPARQPHALKALKRFKMILTIIHA